MTSIAPPICAGCKHLIGTLLDPKCEAFSAGIPADILLSRADHRHPHTSDQGILFAPKTAADAAYADQLFPKSKLTR